MPPFIRKRFKLLCGWISLFTIGFWGSRFTSLFSASGQPSDSFGRLQSQREEVRESDKNTFFFCMSSSQVRTLKLVLDTLLTMKTAVFSRHPVVQHHWKPMLPSKLSVRTRPINYSSLSLDLYMIVPADSPIWAWFMLEVLYAKSGKMDAMVMMEPCWLQVKSMILPHK